MGLRDLIRKKDGLANSPAAEDAVRRLNGPEFTFIRSDTLSQEVIQPPADAADTADKLLSAAAPTTPGRSPRRSLDVFRPRSASVASVSSQASRQSTPGARRRLSQRLHLSRQPESSDNLPDNLPVIVVPADPRDGDGAESQWECRATMLAGQNERARSPSLSPGPGDTDSALPAPVSSQQIDRDIQQAINLHEAGQLESSTVLFARLADPRGANNPLSQVLYGLALR